VNKALFWILGYIEVAASGGMINRLLRLCISNRLELKDLKSGDGIYFFSLTRSDYEAIIKLNERTGCRIVILKYGGLIGLLKFIKRNCYNLILIILIFMIYNYMNSLILEIDYFENSYYTNEFLDDLLNDAGISVFCKKSEISCEAIEEYIYANAENVKCVSAYIEGNILYLNIDEDFSESLDLQASSEIKAGVSGTISDIFIKEGEAVKKAGDEVSIGDVLVSGSIDILNNYEEKVGERKVVPDADILIDYCEELEYVEEFTKEIKVYTGDFRKGLIICYKNDKLFSYIPSNSYTNCDIITSDCAVSQLALFNLPLLFRSISFNEYHYETVKLSNDEARQLIMDRVLADKLKYEESEIEILSEDFQFLETDEALSLSISYLLRGCMIYYE
jgi:similar to stage IV sporulation protein